MLKQFKGEDGGFYQVDKSCELITRPMEIFDSALPSGNAVAMHNLLCRPRLTSDWLLKQEAFAPAFLILSAMLWHEKKDSGYIMR